MNNNPLYLAIIGIAVMLIMVVSILMAVIMNLRKKNQHRLAMDQLREQQQNQLIEAAVLTEEAERHRIAETLHDEVGAVLSSAKLHLLGIKSVGMDEKDQKTYAKGRELLNDVIQRVRGISHALHSNILKEFGLNEAISHFTRKLTDGSSLHTTTSLDDRYPTTNSENDITIYRTVQELVNNILKYANASELIIKSELNDNLLHLKLSHNGHGLTQAEFEEKSYQKDGLGLKNLRNRMILLKGKIEFSKDDQQYHIDMHIPRDIKIQTT